MADVVWPAGEWLAHFAGCRPARCTHELAFPDWWLAMMSRGIPLAPGHEESLAAAVKLVAGFKGYPVLADDEREFVQALVLDGLTAAPQPMTYTWVRHSLGLVASFTRWASGQGIPLDRGLLLNSHQINRWVHGALAGKSSGTQATYRSRLEILAAHTSSEPWDGTRYSIAQPDPHLPLSHQEQADLWLWARSLPMSQQRARFSASLALGLGCGLTHAEAHRVWAEDVNRDLAGVRVRVGQGRDGETRVVTCLRRWEQRLAEVVKDVPAGHLVVTPWRTTLLTKNSFHTAKERACKRNPMPIEWSPARCRQTWIAEHLVLGTPLPVLAKAAGVVDATGLLRMMPFLPEFDEVTASQLMRGVR